MAKKDKVFEKYDFAFKEKVSMEYNAGKNEVIV
jgi:hypothetical protein